MFSVIALFHTGISCFLAERHLIVWLFFLSGWTTSSSAKKSPGWRRSCRNSSQSQVNEKAVTVSPCGVCHIVTTCRPWGLDGLERIIIERMSASYSNVFFYNSVTRIEGKNHDSDDLTCTDCTNTLYRPNHFSRLFPIILSERNRVLTILFFSSFGWKSRRKKNRDASLLHLKHINCPPS